MQLGRLDHVNIRTSNLEAMVAWYQEALGMESGGRPDFNFPGAWLYTGADAAVHLIGVNKDPAEGENLKLEHFAFSATGLAAFLEKLERMGIDYRLGRVRDFGILQVNIHDPDGNHIHVDFTGAEAAEYLK
ncbi:MAG: VOC family protein [Proteobacteria bacterium]|nr:VOC family protein [Pseudomonadota bacterium]